MMMLRWLAVSAVIGLAGCIQTTSDPQGQIAAPDTSPTISVPTAGGEGPFFTDIQWTPDHPMAGSNLQVSAVTRAPFGHHANNFDCDAIESYEGFAGGGASIGKPLSEDHGRWVCDIPVQDKVSGIPVLFSALVGGNWTSSSFFVIPTAGGLGAPPPTFENASLTIDADALVFTARVFPPEIPGEASPSRVSAHYCTRLSGGGTFCSGFWLDHAGIQDYRGSVAIDRASMTSQAGDPGGTVLVDAILDTITPVGAHAFSPPLKLVVPGRDSRIR